MISNRTRCTQNLLSPLLEARRRDMEHFEPTKRLGTNIQRVQKELDVLRDSENQKRLRRWRESMTEDKKTYALLRRKPQAVTPAFVRCGPPAPRILSKVPFETSRPFGISFGRAMLWMLGPFGMKLNTGCSLSQNRPLTRAAYDNRSKACGIDGWTAQELLL